MVDCLRGTAPSREWLQRTSTEALGLRAWWRWNSWSVVGIGRRSNTFRDSSTRFRSSGRTRTSLRERMSCSQNIGSRRGWGSRIVSLPRWRSSGRLASTRSTRNTFEWFRVLTPKNPTRVNSPTSKDCTQNCTPPDGNSCDLVLTCRCDPRWTRTSRDNRRAWTLIQSRTSI